MKQEEIRKALSRKYPQGLVMIVALDEEGRPNAMPASWYMQTSIEPPMFAVSIAPERLTYELVEERKEFVLTLPPAEQKEDVLFCGLNSGEDSDKFEETELGTTEAAEIDTPIIEGSVACFECELAGRMDTGDHRIFSGEVVAAHVGKEREEKIYNFGQYGKKGSSAFKKVIEPEE